MQGFSIQIDETTDRYEDNGSMCEEFLFCKPLPGGTTGAEIFKALDDFFKDHNILWQKCVALCCNGARAMSGSQIGLPGHIRKVAPGILWTHCMIQRVSGLQISQRRAQWCLR